MLFYFFIWGLMGFLVGLLNLWYIINYTDSWWSRAQPEQITSDLLWVWLLSGCVWPFLLAFMAFHFFVWTRQTFQNWLDQQARNLFNFLKNQK